MAALTAAAYLPWLVVGLPAGAWVDRLPARPLMIICDVIAALLYASLPAAAWAGILTTGAVLAVAVLAGTANVVFATAYQVLLPSLVSAGDLVEGNAKLQGGASVAAIGGRGAAGLAAEAIGPATALLVNAASFLVSAACLLRIRTGPASRRPAERATTLRAEIAQGLRFIARDPYLRPLTLYAAAGNFAYAGSTALLVVFLVRVAGFGAVATGLLLGAGSVGGVLASMITRRLAQWLGTARTLLLSALSAGLFSLLIPLTAAGPRAAFYLAGAAVASGGIAAGNIIGRELPAGLLPVSAARAHHRHHAPPGLRHHPPRRPARREPGYRARHPHRAVDHPGQLCPVRHGAAHSRRPLAPGPARKHRDRRGDPAGQCGRSLRHKDSDGTRRAESFL